MSVCLPIYIIDEEVFEKACEMYKSQFGCLPPCASKFSLKNYWSVYTALQDEKPIKKESRSAEPGLP